MTIKQALKVASSYEAVQQVSVGNDFAWAARVLAGAYSREKLISKQNYKRGYTKGQADFAKMF